MRVSALPALRRLMPLCLLAAAAGCTNPYAPPPYATVSGKVLYRGQPLPGGRIGFVVNQGGFAAGATIREDGSYQIKAPVGEVKITVDNTMLRAHRGPSGAPMSEGMKQHSAGQEDPVKGQYVEIPDKYSMPETSGLTYKVQKGDQTYDVKLD